MIALLLRLYPEAWRREYGPELIDMLLARPLTLRIVCDVVWSGVRQRVHAPEPAMLVGLAVSLGILLLFGWNIAAPPRYGNDVMSLLQHPLASRFSMVLLIGFGCWTNRRHDGTLAQSGTAAVKVSLLAGIPVMLAGVLMLLGVLDIAVVGPGETPTTFLEHGFTYTYYNVSDIPAPISILASPLFRLPESWVLGALGGLLGRGVSYSRHRVAPAS